MNQDKMISREATAEEFEKYTLNIISAIVGGWMSENREKIEARGYRAITDEAQFRIVDGSGRNVGLAELIDIDPLLLGRTQQSTLEERMPDDPLMLGVFELQQLLEKIGYLLAKGAEENGGDVLKAFRPMSSMMSALWGQGCGGMIAPEGETILGMFFLIVRHMYIYIITGVLRNGETSFDRMFENLITDLRTIAEATGNGAALNQKLAQDGDPSPESFRAFYPPMGRA